MKSFYIVNNGGDVIYPTDPESGQFSDQEKYTQRIFQLNRNGFYFYWDAGRGHVISFFKGHTGVANQYYGVYYVDEPSNDILLEVQQHINSAFTRQNWSVSSSEHGPTSIHSNLTNQPPIELDIDEKSLHSQLTNQGPSEEPIQLGAPDYGMALGVCKRLVSQFGDIRVSICSSGIVDDLPKSDVVVIPNDTKKPGSPTRGTKKRLEEFDLKARIENTKEDIEAFMAGANEMDGRESVLVDAINSGFNHHTVPDIDDLGLHIETVSTDKKRDRYLASVSVLTGTLFIILITGGLLLYQSIISRLINNMMSEVIIEISFIPLIGSELSGTPVQSHFILVVCVVGLLLAYPIPKAIRLGISLLRRQKQLISTGSKSTSSVNSDSVDETAQSILKELYSIKQKSATERMGGFSEICEDIFSETDSIVIYENSQYKRKISRIIGLGFLKGLLASGVVIILFSLVVVIMQLSWYMFLNGLLALTIITVVSQLYIVLSSSVIPFLHSYISSPKPRQHHNDREINEVKSSFDSVTPDDQLEVLVLGPDKVSPLTHISLLYHHLHVEQDLQPEVNRILHKAYWQHEIHLQKSDNIRSLLESSDSRRIKLTAKEITKADLKIWAPLSSYHPLGNEVFERLNDKYQYNSDRDSNRINRDQDRENKTNKDHVATELAGAITSADVIILLFPTIQDQNKLHSSPYEDRNTISSDQLEYLYRCEELLTKHVVKSQKCLGIITNVEESFLRFGPKTEQHWGEFANKMTDRVFENCPKETREQILMSLDNSADGVLDPVLMIEQDEKNIYKSMGVDVERQYFEEMLK